MAGLTLGQGQYTPFGFKLQNPEQSQDLQIEWPYTSPTDLKREKEIGELRSIVTKLTEEVKKLENIISGIGVVVPIAKIVQVSQTIGLEGSIRMRINEELAKLDISIK